MTTQSTLQKVTADLTERLKLETVSLEYPAFINITNENGDLFVFGNVNETWGLDWYADANDLSNVSDSIQSTVSSASEDACAIVKAYFDCLEQLFDNGNE